MRPIVIGQKITQISLQSIQSAKVEIPHLEQLTHLQFRRFAGCPMCNLHIRSFIQRNDELLKSGIQEVAVFHSSQESLVENHAQAPFALIADPTKALYKTFGVETSLLSVLHPRSWIPALKGTLKHGASLPGRDESPLGLPADFLIGKDGKVLAVKYGTHAYDQWSVDDLLKLAKEA